VTLTLVWAMADNGVIGRSGELPWSLPDDLAHFKKLTHGGTVIMGRKTWDSLWRKPLPGRVNIVVTRNGDFVADGASIVGGLDEALVVAGSEAFCIGGAQLYAAALPVATHLELTAVHDDADGNVFMPPIDWDEWILMAEEFHPADDRHASAFTFRSYERVS